MLVDAGCGALGGPAASDPVPNAGVIGWRLLPSNSQTEIQEPFVGPSVHRRHPLMRGGFLGSAPSIGWIIEGRDDVLRLR